MAEDKMFSNQASDECYTDCSEDDVELFIMSRLQVNREQVLSAMSAVGNDKIKIEAYLIEQGCKPVEVELSAASYQPSEENQV